MQHTKFLGQGRHAARGLAQLRKVFDLMRLRVGPEHRRRLLARVLDAGANGVIHRQAVGMRVMQRIDQAVQVLAQHGQALGLTRPVIACALAAVVQRLSKLLQHLGFTRLGRMQFQAERAQADIGQTAMHHLQRGHFFRDEQHRLAARQQMRDQVRDGLALARTRRPLQHQIAARVHRADRLQLRRIAQQRRQQVFGLVAVVQALKALIEGFFCKRLPRVIDQMPDDAVGFQLLGAVLQVFPHQVLGEREDPQMHLFQHFPAHDFPHGQPERLQHARHVHALVISGQDVQARNAQLVVVAQHLQQRGIDDGLVVVAHQPETAAHRLPLQRHRHQDQRRQVRAFRAGAFGPAQHAHRQVQRVGAALFLPGARRAEDGQQVGVQRFLRDARDQFLVAQRVQRHVVQRRAAAPAHMHFGHARIAAVHQRGGQRAYAEFAAIDNGVFQAGQVRHDERQGGLGQLEVQ
ncbi:Uncharacterised protein [Achromobacter denitrificans]|nr:Uncharacterised protein [Achromobacter denitrificans]